MPWPAGGSTDLAMRALATSTEKYLGQPIVIENKPGRRRHAGRQRRWSRRSPTATRSRRSRSPCSAIRTWRKVGYDPLTDLTYLIGISGYTFGVVVRADAPWKTWEELVAYAKANPGKLSYGTPGANTSLHVTMEDIAQRYGIQWMQVPFKGNADNMQALLGGHIEASADATGWAPHVDAGKMRLLATWGAKRTKRWPRRADAEGARLRHRRRLRRTASPARRAWIPKVAKVLHDAFRKGMEDPAHMQAMEKFDQDLLYMSRRRLREVRARHVRRGEGDDGAPLATQK